MIANGEPKDPYRKEFREAIQRQLELKPQKSTYHWKLILFCFAVGFIVSGIHYLIDHIAKK